MERLGINDIGDYTILLKYKDKEGKELQQLLNLLTTNETYFYREMPQLEAFRGYCLEDVVNRKARMGIRRLRVWCAGCSSGEEPYTLSILIRESLPDYDSWKIEIYAGDIDTEILGKAKQGIYNERSVRYVPESILKKYFTVSDQGFLLHELIKKSVTFFHMNLLDRSTIRLLRDMDFVFCRNVLIYFNDASRKIVMANFYDSLNTGGYIFLGLAESISRINNAFHLKKAGSLILYQKPGQEA